ncbi:hypothetical protein DAPPUDRAFT_238160 [Daphnia pulex]|uniref:Uncharacterized protein n=1 Tax=Daphnia pulex TaxID=6669 RepID=E9G6T3_DAPPU|nr:hypothetical protein DAPPUDRAFT_238160 [Daphnia pulex]|eukprot:EFX85138.1 hypothetical protein DAPPUDRAFT_238160 [Daphnia pulex]
MSAIEDQRTGRPVCMSLRLKVTVNITCKTVNAVVQRLGEKGSCFIIIKQTHPQQRQPKEGKASLHFLFSCSKVAEIITPIPSHVNLKKERPVCIFFTLEGHGGHNASYAVWWVDHWCTDVFLVWRLPNRNAAAFPKATYATTSYCTKVYKYYTTKAPEFYTTISAAPNHYTDVLKYYSAPSYYTTKATDCYTVAPADYYTEAAKVSSPIYTTTTEAAKYYAVPTYYREAALSCYVEQKYYTNAPVRYTTTYAKPQPPEFNLQTRLHTHPQERQPEEGKAINCCVVLLLVVVLKYYTTEASEYYTTTYATPSCITKEPEYCITYPRQRQPATYATSTYYAEAPPPSATPLRLKSYATNNIALSYITKAPEYYTTEALSTTPPILHDYECCPKYYTEAPAYFNTKAVKYYTELQKYYSAPKYTTTTDATKYYVAQTYITAAAPCVLR